MGNARKAKGAELSFSGVSVRGGMFGPTFYIFIEIWRELLPGSREQESSFFPAWENRSRALGLHSKKTRACEAQGKKRQGARFARRSRAGMRDAAKEKTGRATCSAQPRGRARRCEGKTAQRAGVRDGRRQPGKEPRACEAGRKHKHGACLAHRRCVNSGCGLRRWCAGSRGPCGCRACRGTRRKPS